MHCSRGEFGKAVSEIHAWRRNAKDIITPKSGDNFILPIADGTVQLYGREYGIRKFTLMRDQLASSEDLRGDLQGSLEKPQPVNETWDDAETRTDFWSIEGDFTYRHHVESRVQLSVPKEDTFPIPLV